MVESNIEYEKIVKNYLISKSILGKGSYGEVRLACDKNNEKDLIAVKMITKALLEKSGTNVKNLNRELEIMKKFNHKNIVNLRDTVQSSSTIYLFMEFCNGGDLRAYLKNQHGGYLSEEDAVIMMNDFLQAMKYLVSQKCMHRDIKPENILIKNGKLKLADFGFSKVVENMEKSQNNTLLGSPLYASPQILDGKSYSSKCDVFSTGLIFYEILYGEHPYVKVGVKATTIAHLAKAIKEVKLIIPDRPKRNDKLKELLKKMLEKEEDSRYSWENVFEHFDKFKVEYYQGLSDISDGKDLDEFTKSLSEFNIWSKTGGEEQNQVENNEVKHNDAHDDNDAVTPEEEAKKKVAQNIQNVKLEQESVRLNEYVKFERNKAYLINEAITHLAKCYVSKKFPPLINHIYYRIVCCAIKLFLHKLELIENIFKDKDKDKVWKHYFASKMSDEMRQKLQLDLTKLKKTYEQFHTSTIKELNKISEISKDQILLAEISEFKNNLGDSNEKISGLEKIFQDLLTILVKLARNEFDKADKDFLIAVYYFNISKNIEDHFKWPQGNVDKIPDFKKFYEGIVELDKKELVEKIMKG